MAISDHFLGFPQVGGVQRNYNWTLILPDLYGILVSGVIVSKYCQSIKFGQYDITNVDEMRVGQFRRFYPGEFNIDTVTMNFVAPTPDFVSLYLAKWKGLIMDEMGRYNLPSLYKKTAYIIFDARTRIPVNIIKLGGLFPTKYPAYDLRMEGDAEYTSFNIEFKCDYIESGLDALGSFTSEVKEALGSI